VAAFLEEELGDYLRGLELAREVYLKLLEMVQDILRGESKSHREQIKQWLMRMWEHEQRRRDGASPPRHI